MESTAAPTLDRDLDLRAHRQIRASFEAGHRRGRDCEHETESHGMKETAARTRGKPAVFAGETEDGPNYAA